MRRVDSLEKTRWRWEGLRAWGEGDERGWDGWMASPTRWTWVWVNSGSWWWIGRPGVLQFMGSQRFRHNWATELNWTDLNYWCNLLINICSFYNLFSFFLRSLSQSLVLWLNIFNGLNYFLKYIHISTFTNKILFDSALLFIFNFSLWPLESTMSAIIKFIVFIVCYLGIDGLIHIPQVPFYLIFVHLVQTISSPWSFLGFILM